MAKSSSTTNSSFSPSMNFGAPTPSEVANNAGLGPFGPVNWSSGPSSTTTPSKDNSVEVNRPTTPSVDVSNVNADVNNEAVASEVALANNPTINATEDFSWVTDSKWNPETETTHWDSKAEQAREVAGYNQRKARNWTYAGDWHATDKPVYTMPGNSLVPNYENERKYDKFVAPLEMSRAWDESKAMIASENKKADISKALRNAGKDAANVNPEAAKEFEIGEKAAVYPNDMSKAEFDAMYEYALGMTERGGDHEVDDNGEPMMDIWAGMETLPSQIASLTQQIKDIDTRLDSGKVKGDAKKALEADRAELLGKVHEAEAYLESMNTFIDNYASMYNPESKEDKESEESKAYKATEDKYYKASNDLDKARAEFYDFATKKGIDPDAKITETPFYKGYQEIASLGIGPAAKVEKGKSVEIEDAKKGISTKVTHNEDDSWTVVTSNGEEFTGKGDGTDSIASGLGLMGDSPSPNTVFGNANATIGGETAKDYFGDSYNGKGFIDYNVAVNMAEKAAAKAEEDMEKAYTAETTSTHEDATATQQDIMDAYAAGKINAYQAAVALSHIKDSEVSMAMDDITAAIDKDSFKGLGKVDDETIGVDTFKEDVTGENFAKISTEEFTSLNKIAEEINSIDVTNFENIEQAREAKAKLDMTFTNMAIEANNHLEQLVSDLMAEGKSLKEARDNPAFKSMATEVFAMAQAIYDKTCAIEEYTNRYFGDIDISSKRSIKKNIDTLSKRIDVMTDKVSPTMTKEDINALAKYSKSIESTKDAAIALMKASAFNGAKNVKGDFYSEAWKSANAVDISAGWKAEAKNSIRDFFAAFTPIKDSGKATIGDILALGTKGLLGFAAAIVGFSTIAVNPVLGTMFAFAGVKSATENIGKLTAINYRSYLTNEETMFDENRSVPERVWNSVYNRSFEKANIGDPKSVATYTTVFGLLGDFAKLATGVGLLVPDTISSIRDKVDNLAHGGMRGRTDALITNVYNLGKNIVEWADANPGAIESLAREGNRNEVGNTNPSSTSYSYLSAEDDGEEEGGKKPLIVEDKGRETNFGVEGGSAEAASSTFSGAKEQAKNSNLATDYNAGMEQNVNEAVSDERVKGYIVKIYGSEPDYIRNAISKILAAHSEREW